MSSNDATLQQIPITSLEAHPDNPRLVQREDVIESIRAQLEDSGVFSPEHALRVRPVNSHYQIIEGHHRAEAAKRAGLLEVPCWVKDMDDAEAYMQLALGNSQGELSALEIGVHVLKAVELGGGGRGVVGGMRAYARLTGRPIASVSEYRQAAEVLPFVNRSDVRTVLDKASHLAAIHKAPQGLWPLLAETMLAQGWSVKDTEYWVERVLEFDIPEPWRSVFLPLQDIARRFLETHEFSPATVGKLINTAERTEALITSYAHVINALDVSAQYRAWLAENAGGASWDVRQLTKYQRELIAKLEQAELAAERRWNHGDWREFIGDLGDGSVALLLTDPPYGVGYQSDYKLDRRETRRHDPIENDTAEQAGAELRAMLTAMLFKLADNAHVLCFTSWQTEHETAAILKEAGLQVRGSLIWVKDNTGMGDPTTTFAPQHERILHAVKGSPMLFYRESDVLEAPRPMSGKHPTEKPIELLEKLIRATTVEGELVADPFGGVASTLVAAHGLHREYWGCEMDERYHHHGMERLEQSVERTL